jgi:hypothetical protein
MDDGDESEPIPPNVEHYKPVNVVGILEGAADFQKVVPPSSFNDTCPRFDFIRCAGMLLDRIPQMLAGDDMHPPTLLHIL